MIYFENIRYIIRNLLIVWSYSYLKEIVAGAERVSRVYEVCFRAPVFE